MDFLTIIVIIVLGIFVVLLGYGIYLYFCQPLQPRESTFLSSVDEERREAKKAADVEKLNRMRSMQNQLLIQELMTTADHKGFKLIIGVDATPYRIGGYCVRLRDQREQINEESSWAQVYTFKSTKLPWLLNDRTLQGDSAEFEMKNVLFALLLWQKEIEEAKTFSVYTDNFAIRDRNSEYGRRVRGLLNHMHKCKGCRYSKLDISSNNTELFARFIQPADDLSRWQVSDSVNFLCDAYGVNVIKQSHCLPSTVSAANGRKPYHPKSEGYREMLQKVKDATDQWRSPCPRCHFSIEDTGSLQSLAISIN